MKKSNPALYIIFIISTAVIILNRYTALYINDYRVHFFFLFFTVSSLVLIVGQFLKKLNNTISIVLTFIITGILCAMTAFLTWGGDWKTQTILYQNIKNKKQTVNFQLRADRFAFGYKKRIVAVEHLAPFMDWTTDIDTIDLDRSKWKKTDIELNEMKLK